MQIIENSYEEWVNSLRFEEQGIFLTFENGFGTGILKILRNMF